MGRRGSQGSKKVAPFMRTAERFAKLLERFSDLELGFRGAKTPRINSSDREYQGNQGNGSRCLQRERARSWKGSTYTEGPFRKTPVLETSIWGSAGGAARQLQSPYGLLPLPRCPGPAPVSEPSCPLGAVPPHSPAGHGEKCFRCDESKDLGNHETSMLSKQNNPQIV